MALDQFTNFISQNHHLLLFPETHCQVPLLTTPHRLVLVSLYHLSCPILLNLHFQFAQQHPLLHLELDYHHPHQFGLNQLLHLVPNSTLKTHSHLMSSHLHFVQMLGCPALMSYYQLPLVLPHYFHQLLRLAYCYH